MSRREGRSASTPPIREEVVLSDTPASDGLFDRHRLLAPHRDHLDGGRPRQALSRTDCRMPAIADRHWAVSRPLVQGDPMRYFTMVCASLCLLGSASAAQAAKDVVDCSKESLATAVNNVKEKDLTVQFTGICHGPIVITTDGLSLNGVGTAVIDGD